MTKFKTWELSLLIALCFSLCVGTWAQARQNGISSSLVRLHVLAASDEENEQRIKLNVRDAVLEYISPYLEGAETPDEAKRIISAKSFGIMRAAESAAEGRTVTVTLSEEYYPLREYGGFSLPAGRYDSLRVILGEGEGHNWWCVVFPPLCVDAAQQQEALDAMSEDNRGVIADTDGYQLKLRIVELWGEFLELMRQ